MERVRRDPLASLADVEVLTPAEFRERSRSFWLFGTGAGALFAGALLGVIVGTVIVAQTLYPSTKELERFATLRARPSRKYSCHHLPGVAERRDRLRAGLCHRPSGGAHDV